MQYIGKIDIEKLGKYKDKIITNDVIITEERLNHIKEHHKDLSSKETGYLKNVLNDPDYVFLDRKNEDTVLLVKEIKENWQNYRMVLKLSTNTKHVNYNIQNSIISFWHIGEKKLNQYIRNEEILYKKLDKEE